MSFDFSKLNNLKEDKLYRNEYYYKINEEKKKQQEEQQNNKYSIWSDVKNTFNNLMLSAKQGAMQVFKGAETQLESNKNYKMRNQEQFYTSPKVSEIAKTQSKFENNILNNKIKNDINTNKRNSDYGIGNIDLNNRPIYHNEDGSISTVRSMSFWDDDEQKEILVPTVATDKNGKAVLLTDDEAINRYYETGEYLGKFNDYKEADRYAEQLHENQDKLYTNNQGNNTIKDKSLLFNIDDSKIDNEVKKYNNSISDGKIDTNLTRNFLQNDIDKTSEKIQDNTNNINNEFLRKANEQVVPVLGQMGAGMIASAINPALGTLYFTESAVGSYYDDAKQRGMSDSEARKYSTIMGAMEGATEQIGIGNIQKAGKGTKALISGAGKEEFKKALKGETEQITKTTLKSVLKDYGIGIADNVIQEALIDPIQELTAQTVAGKDKAQWEGIGQKMLQDGINGGLVSAILGGANLGIQSCRGLVEKVKNNQQFTQQEVQTSVQDASKKLDVGQMITDSTQQQINKYKDYYTGRTLDNDTQNIINNNNTQNSQQNATQNQINQQTQQITPVQNENVSNLDMAKNDVSKPTIKDFNESAKQYNIDYSNEDLQEINQMFNKRGIKAYFDENTFRNNNDAFSVWKPVTDEQGNISGREVVFNPNVKDSKVRVQELAIHELGHDLDLNEVQDMILKDASRKENWEGARKSLENTYREAYKKDGINISEEDFNKIVDEEATMSILQRELGNQEYVNRLVNQNQSIAKKIYNWVIDKLNKFTGGRNERIFWADIKNKFENAYNQEFNKNDNIAKFSIAGKKSLENIKNDSYSYSRGINSYNNAINLAKQNIDNEQIRQKTGWFQDKNGDWKYEFSDKDMSLKNIKIQKDKIYKLGDILKHDTLFTLYPEVENYKVEINDNIKANASFDRRNNTITINSKLIKNNKSLEGTLIHEIQHAIQNIENFERGTSTKGSKLKYYKSLGEIEATETKGRFLKEKYQNKNMFPIAPESSKANPQHKDLNKYLKNRNLLDKVKDSMYNYFNKRGVNNYDVSEEIVEKDRTQNNSLVDERKRLESENNSGSFSFEKNAKRYEDLLLSNTINYNKRDNGTLNIEMYNGKELINQFTVGSKEETIKQLGNDISNYIYENANENIQTLHLKQQDKNNYKPVTHKEKQLDIIKKTNPMLDDYHVGIRKIEDIKTFEEAIQDEESFSWGDYSKKDAERDLKRNKVRVYSSYAIKNGTFVSTSYEQALEYAGMDRSKVHSKEIRPLEVAWINGDEGQYANINQKYALPTKEWQQFVEDNYQKQGTGKNLKEYNLPTKEDVNKKLNLPTKENINQPTQGEKIDWNEIERPEGKIRKHYRSIIESSNTTKEAKAIAKELMGTDTYVPETNKGQLAQADYRISNSSPEAELKSLMNRVIQGEKVSSVDIAVGERLIQYYSKIGDKTNLQEAIQTTAMAGTSAGQTVQALAMLNHQTPEGQATWIQRSVDKMNNELAKRKGGTITKDEEGNIKVINKQGKDITDKVDLFELTPDMIDKIVSSKNKTEMYDNIDQVYEDLGQQVPLSIMEKIDSWRYFSMLANPKTHIRNMVGNFAMGKTQRLKDKLAGGIEDIVGTFNKDMERAKTLRPSDNKTKEFAKNDVLNLDVQSMMELNENKYNPQSRLQNARKTFKNEALENTVGRLFDWNDKLLEVEDALGLKSAYKKALTDYLTANKIDVDNITDKQLSKARNYAVEQAKEATFHQANAIATAINQFSKKNGLTKGFTDAVLPFVKTPLNVAKAGLEYNPTGLLKTITYDTVKLRKGEITVNKYIDNLSKGLTGTGIAVLGYALADAGILKASGGDDDKKEKYDEALGKQTYSITIGERTYSLDWLSPVGIPLFVGAEAKALRNSQKEQKGSISSDDDKKFNQWIKSSENIANAMANSMSPMSEMSMISGLTSALKSYEQDSTKMLGTIGTNAVKSYANQFVPTLLGQVARTTDDYERSTTSTKSGVLSKAIDQTKLQIMSKVPGLRQKLPTKTDIWGNEQKAEPNIPLRVVNNFVNPSTVKNINTSKVDEELDNLYNKTGESTILPATIDKTYTINGQTYRMTDDEYAKYKKDYGQTSYKLLDDLINSNDYNKLSDDQKQKAIENIYSYAKEVNKVDYAKNNNETVKTSTLYDTLEELKQKGGNQSSYLNYIAKTKDITGEDSSKQKIEVLANSNYTDKTKEIIYKNTEGSKDKKIIVVDKLGLPINEYLKYKSQKFESDKDEDGETVKGSKNQKVYDYLNNIPDEDLSQDYKKIICKMSGINSYDKDIVNLINNNKKLTVNERTEILTNIGFKIDKQGRIQTSSVLPLVKYVK